MGKIESPKSIYEIIEQYRDDMVSEFPEKKEQIVAYADGARMAMDQLLSENRELDEICAFFEDFDETHAEKMLPEIRRKIRGIRFLIKDQIEEGNILMPNSKKS